jgi:pimeloyl-ACP methyl ester carboxylesterase
LGQQLVPAGAPLGGQVDESTCEAGASALFASTAGEASEASSVVASDAVPSVVASSAGPAPSEGDEPAASPAAKSTSGNGVHAKAPARPSTTSARPIILTSVAAGSSGGVERAYGFARRRARSRGLDRGERLPGEQVQGLAFDLEPLSTPHRRPRFEYEEAVTHGAPPLSEWLQSGSFLQVSGHRIFHREEGRGPPIVFVHGFPTSSLDWAPVVHRLRDRYRCITFDLLGFGASDKPKRPYSYALQLDVLDAVLRATGVHESVLVSHDYGATMGQLALAGRSSLRVTRAIFLNGGIVPALHRPLLVQRVLASRLGPTVGPLLVHRRTMERSLRKIVVRTDRLDMKEIWTSIAANDGARVVPRLLHYIAERRQMTDVLLAALTTARVPLGFAWGVDDPVSGGHVLAWVRAHLPAAEVLALEGVGHYPQLEAPDEVAAFVARFAAGA